MNVDLCKIINLRYELSLRPDTENYMFTVSRKLFRLTVKILRRQQHRGNAHQINSKFMDRHLAFFRNSRSINILCIIK